jgi:hypothetical protein
MVSYLERLHQATAELAKRDADPLRGVVETTVRNMDAVSTVALLDLIGLPKTTGNARRVSRTMRSLGFVPIKSRRLMPGGHLNNVTRGWARPVRESGFETSTKQSERVGIVHLSRSEHGVDQQKDARHV